MGPHRPEIAHVVYGNPLRALRGGKAALIASDESIRVGVSLIWWPLITPSRTSEPPPSQAGCVGPGILLIIAAGMR